MTDEEKKYDSGEIERLFFQMDNLLHTRVSSLLLVETIFFVAGATVWKDFPVVLPLCVLGTVATILFTFTNLKLYWRVTWLIEQMKKHSAFYTDYIAMAGIRSSSWRWGCVTLWLLKFVAPESPEGKQPRWLDTGWLYTWGLCLISVIGFITLAIVSKCFGNGKP